MKNAPIRPYIKKKQKKRLFDEFLKLQKTKTLKKKNKGTFDQSYSGIRIHKSFVSNKALLM